MNEQGKVIDFVIEGIKILVPISAAWLAYLFAVRKLKQDNRESIERHKYEAILQAHRRAWSLIAYMSEMENAMSIVRWKKEKNERLYFFYGDNARKFLEQLRVVFYDEGHGIFLSREVTDLLFEYRVIVYGLLLNLDGNDKSVQLQNEKQARTLFEKSVNLIKEIRKAMEITERRLELKK